MPITYKKEDNLAKLSSAVSSSQVSAETVSRIQQQMQAMDGCINLGPLKVCYHIQLPKIVITVSVLGITIGTITLDPTNPCQTLKIDLWVASGKIELCIKGSCLKLSGEVCAVGQCVNWNDITIICWG